MGLVHILGNENGVIYVVTPSGDLLFYKDLAQDGTENWAGNGVKIGGPGWDSFLQVFSGGDGIIYAVTPSGDLLFYKDLARDGTENWAGNGVKIGGPGWTFE